MSNIKVADGKKIVCDSHIGLWVVEFKEGMRPRFHTDETMDELLGISAETSPEERFEIHHSRIHPDDLEMFEEYSDKLAAKRTEVVYRYMHPDKGEMYVRCCGLRDMSETRFIRIEGVHQDISDIVRFEKEKTAEARLAKAVEEKEAALIKAQRASVAKTEFLSRMSHDIRTPLNGIIGIMDINEKHSDDVELVTANRRKARVAAEHLLSLINDILDMSKLEDDSLELNREPMNLFEEFGDVVTIINLKAMEKGVTVEHDGGPEIIYPDVFGSKLHFKQIMMNVLSNCVKYNRVGGKIYGSTELVSKTNEQVIYRFTVRDTGIGMTEEFLEHIFEPFTQEKNDARSRYQGTGMGMAIVKKLCEKMGGSIEVESKPGEGSTFYITLPFEINYYSDAEDETVSSNEVMIKGRNILLVEDNDLNADIAKYILEDAGATVSIARNGLEAVEIFTGASPGTYDAILMDIMMPIMDGYTATEHIRKSDKADADTIPIIALSANAFAEDVRKAKSYGMNDHLSKPLDVKLLIRTIGKYMT